MAIFVAELAIDLAAFARFDLINSILAVDGTPTSSDLKAHVNNVAFEFTSAANDFTVTDQPHGTISAIDVKVDGAPAYNLSGLSLSFDTLLTAAQSPSTIDALVKTILAGDDTITGSKFNDTIAGFDGSDTLKGGKGKDLFLFNTEFGANNVDTIKDFNHKDDTIGFDHTLIGADAGKVKSKYFTIGTKAADKNDHVIYNDKNGKLYLDPDGKGHEDQVLVAILKHHPTIDVHDFLIV